MRIVAMAIAMGLMAGCVMPIDDMINNRYMDYPAQAVPAGMDGNWTGVMGPYLMTLQLRENGTGELCNSYGSSNYLQAVKFNDGVIYIQDGTRMSADLNGDALAVEPPYAGSQASRLQRDSDLAMAAPYCKQNL